MSQCRKPCGRPKPVPSGLRAILLSAALLFAAAAAASAPARAAEWASAEYGFALDLPEGREWLTPELTSLDQSAIGPSIAPIIALADLQSGRAFMVFAQERDRDEHGWGLAQVNALHHALVHSWSGHDPSGCHCIFQGMPAYECGARRVRVEGSGFVRITAVMSDRFRYCVVREKFPGDPADDQELEAMRRSFRLTGHPQPPPPAPPETNWIAWSAAAGGVLLLAALGFTLLWRRRGRGNGQKRMRYRYSKKAQELAGNTARDWATPAADAEPLIAPPRSVLAEQERDAKRMAGASRDLLTRGVVGSFMSLTQAPDPSELHTEPNTGPLKLDRRFLKGQELPPEEDGDGNEPSVPQADAPG